jgi:hypothetical protein
MDLSYIPGSTTNQTFDAGGYGSYNEYADSDSYYGGSGYYNDSAGSDAGGGYGYTDYADYSYSYDYSYSDYSYSDYSYGGDYGFAPVILDLSGAGINLTPLGSSNTFFDMFGDGRQHRTAWAGTGNAVLAFDADGDGQITQRNEVVFTDWDPAAANDMQALANVFDTNHDGRLDAGDAQFANFRVIVTNADGTATLETLAQAGIA